MEKTAKSTSNKKKYRSWTKSISNDTVRKDISVEECENGYYICYREESTENWETLVNKKYISKTNPLEGKAEELPTLDSTVASLGGLI